MASIIRAMRVVAVPVLLVAAGAALAQPAAAPQACDKPRAPGTTRHELSSGGHDRAFLLHVPAGYDGSTPRPAVLSFHGSGSNPEQQLAIADLIAAAEERALLVIAPYAATETPAGGYTWNVPPDASQPDDVAFVAALLDDVAASVCVDTSRVYASGFSGGARLASQLACELSDRIAAIGAVAGLRHPSECRPVRPTPIVTFHGTADPVNPYDGGGPAYWGYGVEVAVEGWAEQHGAGGVAEERISPSVTRVAYAGRGKADAVVLYRIEGAGHVWPGTPVELPVERLGATTDEVDATSLMLDFFEGAGASVSVIEGRR